MYRVIASSGSFDLNGLLDGVVAGYNRTHHTSLPKETAPADVVKGSPALIRAVYRHLYTERWIENGNAAFVFELEGLTRICMLY